MSSSFLTARLSLPIRAPPARPTRRLSLASPPLSTRAHRAKARGISHLGTAVISSGSTAHSTQMSNIKTTGTRTLRELADSGTPAMPEQM
jgi:hypothetical protein